MLTIKDKTEQFKRDLKSYGYYQKKIQECNEKLEEIAVKIQGISSPAVKEVTLENARNPYSENKLYWMEEEGKVVLERSKYIQRVLEIDEVLNLIVDKEVNEIIYRVFINKEPHQHVADDFSMDRSTMYRKVNEELKKILSCNIVHEKT